MFNKGGTSMKLFIVEGEEVITYYEPETMEQIYPIE